MLNDHRRAVICITYMDARSGSPNNRVSLKTGNVGPRSAASPNSLSIEQLD